MVEHEKPVVRCEAYVKPEVKAQSLNKVVLLGGGFSGDVENLPGGPLG